MDAVSPRTYLAAAPSFDGSSSLFGGGADSVDCTSAFSAAVTEGAASAPAPALALSRARCGLAAARAGGGGGAGGGADTVLFAGGNSRLGYTGAVDAFVYANGSWAPAATAAGGGAAYAPPKLAVARSWLVGASAPPHLACFVGGFEAAADRKSAAVECFDARRPAAGLARLPDLPSGRMFHAAVGTRNSSSGGATLWVGGGTDDNDVTAAVSVLHIPPTAGHGAPPADTAGWAQLAHGLSSRRTKLAVAAAPRAGRVAFAGGEGDDDGGGGEGAGDQEGEW